MARLRVTLESDISSSKGEVLSGVVVDAKYSSLLRAAQSRLRLRNEDMAGMRLYAKSASGLRALPRGALGDALCQDDIVLVSEDNKHEYETRDSVHINKHGIVAERKTEQNCSGGNQELQTDVHVKRWRRNAGCIVDDSAASSAQPAQSGRLIEPGVATFPVMTREEVAAIAVPASAPGEQIRATLAQHGVCLVTDVLKQQEISKFEDYWRDDLLSVLEHGSTYDPAVQALHREGVCAWPQAWSSALGTKGSVSRRGLPHGSFAWNARLHAGVRKVFADVYERDTQSLAVGLDCTFWSGADTEAAYSNNEWLHCDQNYQTGLTWRCAQGVLYVWSSEGEAASTTVVWPGSHGEVYRCMMADGAARTRGRRGGQSLRLSQLSDPHLREDLTRQAVASSRRVPCPAGSLLLWDSRTIHQGWNGGPRLAQPVCWEPRERREQDSSALQRKVFMCAAGVPSSHSSAEARVHGMASRSRPVRLFRGENTPGFVPQILPACVRQDARESWEAAQPLFWGSGGDPRRNSERADVEEIGQMLKPEVLQAL